jgi:glutamate N-acetyltransferase / amino-acid N-acetyltransferase
MRLAPVALREARSWGRMNEHPQLASRGPEATGPAVATGTAVATPSGFVTYAGSAGVKDGTPDVSIIASTGPCAADGVFTKSLFAGPSVALSKEHLVSGTARAIVTVSKNANVANGRPGEADAAELAQLVAGVVGCGPQDVLVASTGVIGRRYPMAKIRDHFGAVQMPTTADLASVAAAIMTTDTFPKLASARAGAATVTGIAKGSGMIEPDMATMLAYVITDAAVAAETMGPALRRVVEVTFNSLSIDTDTSTSDSVLLLANGSAGEVASEDFEAALHAVCLSLTLQLAADGEGATRVVQVRASQARDYDQAKRVAKAIVNSPLVKCAVHGADPNWGRVAMAIGKCSSDTDIKPEGVRIEFAGVEVYPAPIDSDGLAQVSKAMEADVVEIGVALGTGHAMATVWGCDLSSEYVHINADYTT